MRYRLCWLFLAYVVSGPTDFALVRADDVVPASASADRGKQVGDAAEIREFEVRVDNKAVGTHRLTLESDGTKQRANIQTDVKIDLVVYAYVFKSRGTEVWNDGRLEASEIRCEDGGKKRSFTLKTAGSSQEVFFNGKPVGGSANSFMTTAYWKLPAAELRSKPFSISDVDTGKLHTAKLDLGGPATITVDGQTIKCQYVKIDGPSPAELWFDDRDWLVKQKSVERGHSMELKLKQIRLAKNERPRK